MQKKFSADWFLFFDSLAKFYLTWIIRQSFYLMMFFHLNSQRHRLSIVLSIHFSARGYSLRYLWVPLDVRKNIFNRFSCIFTSFWVTFTLVECNLMGFQKKSIWHPCVVVGTPRYPQMAEKIFLIVFPAYLHHCEPLLLWSDAIWRDFPKKSILASLRSRRYP